MRLAERGRRAAAGGQGTQRDRQRPASAHARRIKRTLALELLEERLVLSNITVTTKVDEVTPGDNLISLREAISQANADPAGDSIALPSGTLTLSIAGTGEDGNATGDLDITNDMTLNGSVSGPSIITANTIDRVMQIIGAHTVTLNNVTIEGGSVTGNGGGIDNEGGTLILNNCTITGNSVSSNGTGLGGGIYSSGGSVTLTNSVVNLNQAGSAGGATGQGGGIYVAAGAATLTNSTVSNDTAAQFGGGVFNAGTLTVTGSTFSGNSAGQQSGGGLDNTGVASFTNSTFSGNSAAGHGGGLFNNGASAVLTLLNATIANNTALSGGGVGVGDGGGIFNTSDGATVSIKNTIVAKNNDLGGANIFPDVAGPFVSQGHNLVGNNAGSTGFNVIGDQAGTPAATIDPKLGQLANNGGPTLTLALLPGSPAIDTGDNTGAPNVDQRGQARPIDGGSGQAITDIGAFELLPSTSPLITTLGPTSSVEGHAAFTLTVNGANFVAGSVVSFNNQSLVTTFVNAGQLTATVPAASLLEEGTATVLVTNPGNDISNRQSFTINDAPLNPGANRALASTMNVDTGSVTVATFSDSVPPETVANYSAKVDWGDGSAATTGQISLNGTTFSVMDHHTYAAVGPFTITVSIHEEGGSSTSATASMHVVATDGRLPADFDGDHKSDIGVFRPSTAQWLSKLSGGTSLNTVFGTPNLGDIPVPGDYDGVGHAELAVFRPSTAQWMIKGANGIRTVQFGAPNLFDIPVVGDFDGDGKTDLAVFRPSTAQWLVKLSGGGTMNVTFGAPNLTDLPVPADFEGDGKTDLAVFRPSTGHWLVKLSSGGTMNVAFGGLNLSDIPAPGDYDGVGHAEFAVFRPSTAQWFIKAPTGGHNVTFGAPNLFDLPLEGPIGSLVALGIVGNRSAAQSHSILGPPRTAASLNLADVPIVINTGAPPAANLVSSTPPKKSASAWLAALDSLANENGGVLG